MDKLKKHILFILLISILLCSVQAIAAADVSDADGNDVFDLSNDIETVQAGSVDDVIMASEDTVNDNSEILSASNSDEVLSAEPDGNFTQLRNRINGASDTLELDRDYVYDSRYDDYYVGTSGISINKNIVIDGKGHTIDAKGFSRIFQLTGNHEVTLKNIVFINGFAGDNYYGGAIYSGRNQHVTLTVDNCTFRNNSANLNRDSSRGGAIYLRTSRGLIINNSRFENNSAYYGGAIYGDRYVIDNCNFTGNKAYRGSAIYSYAESGAGAKSISNTRILDNQARATSLSFDYLNPSSDPWTGEIIFDGFIGNFTGQDNLINGIFSDGTYPSFKDVTYLGEDGEITTSSVPTRTTREAGIPIHVIITQNGDIVKDILVTTNSTGGYMVTEEELMLDYGTYSAYAVHNEDDYYTFIQSRAINNFNSYMHCTVISNETITGYAGDKVNVTFNVTYNTTDRWGRVTVHNVTDGTVIVSIGNQNYTATVRNGQAKVEVVLPEESGDYTALYDGTDTSYWNSTGTLKITILKNDTSVTVTPKNITVGEDETIKFTVTDTNAGTQITDGTVNITITGEGIDPIEMNDVPIANGIDGVTISNLAAGTYTVMVKYGGDDKRNPSSGSNTFTVSKSDSSVSVTADNINVGATEQVSFTVTGPESGSVNVTILDSEGNEVASKIVAIGSVAEFDGLAAGDYKAVVSFEGDDAYGPSSGSNTFTVSKSDSSVSVTADNINVGATEQVSFTVTGSVSGIEPTGNVTITITCDNIDPIVREGVPVTDASVDFSGLPAGTYTVKVTYNGDDFYGTSSDSKTFTVKKIDVIVTVETEVVGFSGDTIQVTIKVVGVNGETVEGGTVTYTIDYNTRRLLSLGEGDENVDDSQAIVGVTLNGAPGSYDAKASYSGNDMFNARSADDEAIILPLGTTTESKDVSGTVGDKVTITADIKDQNNDAVQNGTATLTIDGKEYTAKVENGKAVFENVEISKNTTATIKYEGNDYYNSSETTINITVEEAPQPEPQPAPAPEPTPSEETAVKVLATGNPIAMLLLVLLTLVSTISIRRQK